MGVQLNIKNAEAHELASRLAKATGESITEAVTQAIRERLDRVKPEQTREEKIEAILAIGRQMKGRWKEPWKSMDHGQLLYDDELGLPK